MATSNLHSHPAQAMKDFSLWDAYQKLENIAVDLRSASCLADLAADGEGIDEHTGEAIRALSRIMHNLAQRALSESRDYFETTRLQAEALRTQ